MAENACGGVPIVIVVLIPGQESRNADIWLESGDGLKVNDLPLLKSGLGEGLC